jgi:sugar phosphate isomerase/epimerase
MPSQKNLHRRNFLQFSGMSLIASTALFNKISAAAPAASLPNISMQLYTVRNQIKNDIAGTLKRIKEIGFTHVETAFWPEGITLQQAAGHIKDAGLLVSSCHIELPIGDNKAKFVETAKAFNCSKMIWHGWPEDKRYSSLEGTKELAAIYNEASHVAKVNGLQFGLHNHWWEFRNKAGGRYVYEVLLAELEPDIFFELDTYWLKVAGHDPAAIVGAFAKRAPFLHIKDGPARWNDNLPQDNPDPMTAVGKGTQNFPAIAKAANGNTQWMVIEMDAVATDVFVALEESYQYLVKNKLAKGK